MDGINQIHVNPAIGLTFAAGLRHIVRQDPDVIMVGEIRDRETADIAIRAALTGHFVFSTLHTNDAPSAVTRLVDMGVENYLINSSVVAILAQRLVRLICEGCKESAGKALTPFGEEIESFRGHGCPDCNGSGYKGRAGIFELMELNDELRQLIMANAMNTATLRDQRENRMVPVEISVVNVGYFINGEAYHNLPPRPPMSLDPVYLCDHDCIYDFTQKFDFFRLVLNTPEVPAEELLAAALKHAASARPAREQRDFLVRAGRRLAQMLSYDLPRLNHLLRLIRP